MAVWNKIKFYCDTMLGSTGSTLTATSTASGDYSVNYLYNMLETNMWKAADATSPQYISLHVPNSKKPNYLAIIGHNLCAIGATIVLQRSPDNATYTDAFTAFAPAADTVILKEFTAPVSAYDYWRLKITGQTISPYMAICIWGEVTELDYATASFDPHEQDVKANVNLSQGGYVAGIHTQYTERSMTLKFDDADVTLYGKIKTWWETSGLKNFFMAWENANTPGDVFLMRPDMKFSNPLKNGGLYRDITINLKGRKE